MSIQILYSKKSWFKGIHIAICKALVNKDERGRSQCACFLCPRQHDQKLRSQIDAQDELAHLKLRPDWVPGTGARHLFWRLV